MHLFCLESYIKRAYPILVSALSTFQPVTVTPQDYLKLQVGEVTSQG